MPWLIWFQEGLSCSTHYRKLLGCKYSMHFLSWHFLLKYLLWKPTYENILFVLESSIWNLQHIVWRWNRSLCCLMIVKVMFNLDVGMCYHWWTWMTIWRSFWKCHERMLFIELQNRCKPASFCSCPTNEVKLLESSSQRTQSLMLIAFGISHYTRKYTF